MADVPGMLGCRKPSARGRRDNDVRIQDDREKSGLGFQRALHSPLKTCFASIGLIFNAEGSFLMLLILRLLQDVLMTFTANDLASSTDLTGVCNAGVAT